MTIGKVCNGLAILWLTGGLWIHTAGRALAGALNEGVAESVLFRVDTRIGGNAGSSESIAFTLDTRMVAAQSLSIRGQVMDESGAPVSGALVQALKSSRALASATTEAQGQYHLDPLALANYEMRVSFPGKATFIRIVPLSVSEINQDFALRSINAPPKTEETSQTPESTQDPKQSHSTPLSLKVYTANGWANQGLVDRTKPTIVLTHGWVVSDDGGIKDWPTKMAAALWAHLEKAADRPNIVAWDWMEDAKGALPPVDNTTHNGQELGESLYSSLGDDYSKHIHFLGHSLGTLLNAYAGDYLSGVGPLRGWSKDLRHFTLFDEAEIATIAGRKTIIGASIGALAGGATSVALAATAANKDWRTPIPKEYGWIDNYVALVGFYREEAVNVYLPKAAQELQPQFDIDLIALSGVHSYPMAWYRESIQRPAGSILGFSAAYEQTGIFPPTGARYDPGNSYEQSLDSTVDVLALHATSHYPGNILIDEALSTALETTLFVAAQVKDVAVKTHNGAVLVGNAVIETADRAWDEAVDLGNDFVGGAIDIVNNASFGLELFTTPQTVTGRRMAKASEGDSASPAYAWMTVAVPPRAYALTFDFKVKGEGHEDTLVVGLNGTNVFGLKAKMVTRDAAQNSGPIDISSITNTTAEIFFGILGGTSTNCVVSVGGIRFLTFAEKMSLSVTNSQGVVLLSWPKAEGWRLESAANLAAPEWETVTNRPSATETTWVLTNAPSDSQRFYRLRQP